MSTTVESKPHRAANLWDATAELVAAGQQVLLDRVDLLRTEIGDDVRATVTAAGMVLVAGLTAAFGWVVTCAALVVFLADRMPPALALLIVGGAHLVGGGVLGAVAVRRFGRIPPLEL